MAEVDDGCSSINNCEECAKSCIWQTDVCVSTCDNSLDTTCINESRKCPEADPKTVTIIAAVVVAVIALAGLCMVGYFLYYKRKKKRVRKMMEGSHSTSNMYRDAAMEFRNIQLDGAEGDLNRASSLPSSLRRHDPRSPRAPKSVSFAIVPDVIRINTSGVVAKPEKKEQKQESEVGAGNIELQQTMEATVSVTKVTSNKNSMPVMSSSTTASRGRLGSLDSVSSVSTDTDSSEEGIKSLTLTPLKDEDTNPTEKEVKSSSEEEEKRSPHDTFGEDDKKISHLVLVKQYQPTNSLGENVTVMTQSFHLDTKTIELRDRLSEMIGCEKNDIELVFDGKDLLENSECMEKTLSDIGINFLEQHFVVVKK